MFKAEQGAENSLIHIDFPCDTAKANQKRKTCQIPIPGKFPYLHSFLFLTTFGR